MPTFSPAFLQPLGNWLESDGLCEMVPAAAIFADHERATETRVPSTASGARPFEERREFVSDRKRASSEPVSARAVGTAITIANPVATSVVIARTRFDISRQPLCHARPGGDPWPGDHAPVFFGHSPYRQEIPTALEIAERGRRGVRCRECAALVA